MPIGRIVCAFMLAASAAVPAGPAAAAPVRPEVPVTLTVNVPPGRYHFAFTLYDSPNPFDPFAVVWSEGMNISGPPRVLKTNQLTHRLGSIAGNLDPAFFSEQLWIQAKYYAGGLWVPCSKMTKLSAVPYAMWSANAVPVCVPGDFVSCYEGPRGTLGVGTCANGVRTCNEDGYYVGTTCAGQVVPEPEDCNGLDDNCDGNVDDNATCLATGGICNGGVCVPCEGLPGGCMGPVTITFSGLTEPGVALGAYDESGFTVSAVSGDWKAMGYGHPGPAIVFTRPAGPAVEVEVAVTAGGADFRFDSVELYSSLTTIPYVITGYKGPEVAFTLSGTVPNTFGAFALVMNPSNLDVVDRLSIRVTNPATECCSNPVGIDNVAVSR